MHDQRLSRSVEFRAEKRKKNAKQFIIRLGSVPRMGFWIIVFTMSININVSFHEPD